MGFVPFGIFSLFLCAYIRMCGCMGDALVCTRYVCKGTCVYKCIHRRARGLHQVFLRPPLSYILRHNL